MANAKKVFMVFLVMLTIVSSCLVLPAQAATSSYGNATRTITVNTKAAYYYPGSSSITLKQTKGTYSYLKNGRTRNGTDYYNWDISVCSTDGKHSYKKDFNGSSIKLSLKPNKTYIIRIYPDSYQTSIQEFRYHTKYISWKWVTMPSWRVSGSWKINNYY